MRFLQRPALLLFNFATGSACWSMGCSYNSSRSGPRKFCKPLRWGGL